MPPLNNSCFLQNKKSIMKKVISLNIFFLLLFAGNVMAQQFVNKGTITYEVKTSIQKTMGSGTWAEMMKDNMSKFKTGYFKLVFNEQKSAYVFDHWDANMKMPTWMRQNDEQSKWYMDQEQNLFTMQKSIYGTSFSVKDTIPKIIWKLENESRIIAGFTCRKASAIVMDSVYVFVFYTDEITSSGGPCSISGLPGTILGMTIPRMYTSWIATEVMPGVADEKLLKPLSSKKMFTRKELLATLRSRTSDWGSDDEEGDNHVHMLFWNTML